MTELYIGLLSGTSIDNIDAALFEIDNNNITLNYTLSYPINNKLKQALHELINNNDNIQLEALGKLNKQLGIEFANSVNQLLAQNNISNKDVTAIGLHGQTVFHCPDNFTMQIGCPTTILELTKIPVITDFRQRDMLQGGQGAPLAPLIHQKLFIDKKINRAIINIGGITNITLLVNNNQTPDTPYIASDLGPGNTLLDNWCKLNINLDFDKDGEWAGTGEINQELLNKLLSDSYFSKAWPKSTGREYFNINWLNKYIKNTTNIPQDIPQDIQRTLLELTSRIITDFIIKHKNIAEVYLCGGGTHNKLLFNSIKQSLNQNNIKLDTTDKLNMPVDWVEAALFAYLAYCNLHKIKLNLKYITGNQTDGTLLGCLYY